MNTYSKESTHNPINTQNLFKNISGHIPPNPTNTFNEKGSISVEEVPYIPASIESVKNDFYNKQN